MCVYFYYTLAEQIKVGTKWKIVQQRVIRSGKILVPKVQCNIIYNYK